MHDSLLSRTVTTFSVSWIPSYLLPFLALIRAVWYFHLGAYGYPSSRWRAVQARPSLLVVWSPEHRFDVFILSVSIVP
ncbi:hypothetical protein M378DRAFT_378908 [Amanita muscaria Koide BX008]|uniref:Uncharacterized protein n=1 Tax=Amanita muscaria (strain Koide BX008) TaxID=946122 RepID=A0A0C2W8T3_AMAMK|nr:hypothetical protein M378DRAFT_378908 [Amanita muscaria Koide BX008]